MESPEETADIFARFHSDTYRRINARRLEHLATLDLPIDERTVLQVGAGIGDLAEFFTDRGCAVTLTEGRQGNLEVMRQLHPDLPAFHLDLDEPDPAFEGSFDIVFCYGTLYHLAHPAEALAFMAARCDDMFLLETCVQFGSDSVVTHVTEELEPDQALAGKGSRPTRAWVHEQLAKHFEYVYSTTTQPAHPEFPTDWTVEPATPLTRAVFVASRESLDNPRLTTSIPERQERS